MDNQTGRIKKKISLDYDVEELDLPSKPPRTILLNIKGRKDLRKGKRKYQLNISLYGGVSVT